jgi:hypothetical protein
VHTRASTATLKTVGPLGQVAHKGVDGYEV